MPYTSLDILTDRYGSRMLTELSDRAEVASGTIDSDVIDRAIADSDAMIDGYLAGRYLLPLAEVPPLVADLAQVIAVYKLHTTSVSDKIRDDYQTALKQLDKIAAGTIRLPVAGVEPTGTGDSGARMTDRERPMTEATLKGFI